MSKKIIKNVKKIEIGLVILILFVSLLPLDVLGKGGKGKGKGQHGKLAEFSITYGENLEIPEFSYFPAESVSWELWENDGGWALIDSGTTDATGLLSFEIKRNMEYRLDLPNWLSGRSSGIIENPTEVIDVELEFKTLQINKIYWNDEVDPLTFYDANLYYWNTTSSEWTIIDMETTDDIGAVIFDNLVFGTYSFDTVVSHVISDESSPTLIVPEVRITPLIFSNSEIYIKNQA